MTPAITSFEDRTIPSHLKDLPQWVNWKAVPNGERTDKVPMCGTTGQRASSTDPATWTDYTTAGVKALSAEDLGVGFAFTKEAGVIGIDLDKCRDRETGTLEPWAEDIVREMQTYTEVSPSGRGLHLFLRGTLPPGKRKKGRVEVYDSGRFFTVTGQHLANTPLSVEERIRELAEFHAKYFADPEPTPPSRLMNKTPDAKLSDEEILLKCRAAKNAAKFEALWRGGSTGYPSHSDADLALLGILKFYTQDAAQIDRLFRQSGLMRDKWDEKRGVLTYGERTITEALSHVAEAYASGQNNDSSDISLSGMSVPLSDDWPEIQPVKAELFPVPPLPLEIVPPTFRGLVKDVSERMQCPPDYVAAAMLVMVGSIIGAGCGIRPKKNDDWTVVPNLWGGVVGRPSMLKTPAIAEAMKPLDALEREAKLVYDAAQRQYEAEQEAFKAHKDSLLTSMRKVANGKASAGLTMDGLKYDLTALAAPFLPVWRRYKTNDATVEKMAELQAENPRGLLIFRDELIGLFATWDKDGHESDRAFFLEGFNGLNSYTADRIGRGHIHTPSNTVSLFGGIQPTKLSSYLYAAMRGHNNDGLVQRLQVLVYPDEPSMWKLIDTPIDSYARQTAHHAVQQLARMDFRQHGAYGDEQERVPYYRFSDEGQQVFYQWWEELETILRTQEDEPVVLEHLGKYRSLMPSLALIFHLLELASSSSPVSSQVSARNATCAAAWCGYLERHARRIYGLVTNVTQQAARRLAGKLKEGGLSDRFTIRDVYRKDWSLLDDRPLIEKACDELVALGWLREKTTPSAPGQRGKTEYLINPKVRTHG